MEGVVSGCFRFNINGPMSVASTVDDLRGFVTRSSGRNALRTPKNVCGEATISEAEGGISTNSEFRGVCRQRSSL